MKGGGRECVGIRGGIGGGFLGGKGGGIYDVVYWGKGRGLREFGKFL